MTEDHSFMARAIQLAKNGLGATYPNPMVGCVIVNQGKIIGEGFTSPYGKAHAEVNAIASVKDKSLLQSATLYVTLEPCSHFGKTPPCADLIVTSAIPKVVVGLLDPNPLVAGKGVNRLKAAGCSVIVGVKEKECREHHRRFLTYQEKKRPYIILKWAETQDGFIAPMAEKRTSKPEPFWITNPHSRQLVHQWRAEEQAILVGTTTVLEDNPRLNVRDWTGANPYRVVLDRRLSIPVDYHVLNTNTPTLVFTEIEDATLYKKGVNYEVLDFSSNLLEQMLTLLYEYRLTSVLVEGGARTLHTFIDANIWDEARVFVGSGSFGEGIKAPDFSGSKEHTRQINLDTLTIYRNA